MGNYYPLPTRPVHELDELLDPHWKRRSAVSLTVVGALSAVALATPAVKFADFIYTSSAKTAAAAESAYPLATISVPDCNFPESGAVISEVETETYASGVQSKIKKAQSAVAQHTVGELAAKGCKLIIDSGEPDPGNATMNVTLRSITFNTRTSPGGSGTSWFVAVTSPSYTPSVTEGAPVVLDTGATVATII